MDLTEDPTAVTCEECQRSEDYTAAREFLQLLASTPEARDFETDTITIMRGALAAMSAPKVDGTLIDLQSVNAIVTVYDWRARYPQRQKEFAELPVLAIALRAWDIIAIAKRKDEELWQRNTPCVHGQLRSPERPEACKCASRRLRAARVYCGR